MDFFWDYHYFLTFRAPRYCKSLRKMHVIVVTHLKHNTSITKRFSVSEFSFLFHFYLFFIKIYKMQTVQNTTLLRYTCFFMLIEQHLISSFCRLTAHYDDINKGYFNVLTIVSVTVLYCNNDTYDPTELPYNRGTVVCFWTRRLFVNE